MDSPVILVQGGTLSKVLTVVGEDAQALQRRLQATLDAVPPGEGWALTALHAAGAGAGGKWIALATIEQVSPSAFTPSRAVKDILTAQNAQAPTGTPLVFDFPNGTTDPPQSVLSAGSTFLVGGETVIATATGQVTQQTPVSDGVFAFLGVTADGIAVPADLLSPNAAEFAYNYFGDDADSMIAVQAFASGLPFGPHSFNLVLACVSLVGPVVTPHHFEMIHAAIQVVVYGPSEGPAQPIAVPGARVWAVEGAGDVEVTPQAPGAPLPARKSVV